MSDFYIQGDNNGPYGGLLQSDAAAITAYMQDVLMETDRQNLLMKMFATSPPGMPENEMSEKNYLMLNREQRSIVDGVIMPKFQSAPYSGLTGNFQVTGFPKVKAYINEDAPVEAKGAETPTYTLDYTLDSVEIPFSEPGEGARSNYSERQNLSMYKMKTYVNRLKDYFERQLRNTVLEQCTNIVVPDSTDQVVSEHHSSKTAALADITDANQTIGWDMIQSMILLANTGFNNSIPPMIPATIDGMGKYVVLTTDYAFEQIRTDLKDKGFYDVDYRGLGRNPLLTDQAIMYNQAMICSYGKLENETKVIGGNTQTIAPVLFFAQNSIYCAYGEPLKWYVGYSQDDVAKKQKKILSRYYFDSKIPVIDGKTWNSMVGYGIVNNGSARVSF